MSTEPPMDYDEFSFFADNASEAGLPWHGDPVVRRTWVEVAPGRRLSALVWGPSRPSWYCSMAADRTPTPGTPWRWPWTSHW